MEHVNRHRIAFVEVALSATHNMVVPPEFDTARSVVFLIEGTAINGAYLQDMKQNYIIPTLEYFTHGCSDERDTYGTETSLTLFGIVVYKTAQSMPGVCCSTFGPYANPQKVRSVIDSLE